MPRVLDLAAYVYSADITDFETTYAEVAEAGFHAVVLGEQRGQFDLRVPEQAQAARRVLERLGLKGSACHGLDVGPGGMNDPDEAARAALMRAHAGLMASTAAIGAVTYVLHIGSVRPEEPKAASWERVRRCVDELAPQAERLGIALALENGLPGYLMTNEELRDFVAGYAHPAVGICYDSGHAHVTADAAAGLRLFAPYVVTVHLHDNDGTGDQHLMPGQGTLNWPAVVAELARCPRLVHAEGEAVNSARWPPTPEVWPQRRVYECYMETLNPPGAEVCFQ
jgi:sugar phosphate isomerase/epimerase